MNDASRVGSIERVRNLDTYVQYLFYPQGTRAHSGGQRLANDKFHNQKVNIFGLLQPINHRDVRMVQRRQHPRFALKTRQPVRTIYEGCRQDFDGDVAIQFGVVRLIDLSHAPRTQESMDFVSSELGTAPERPTRESCVT